MPTYQVSTRINSNVPSDSILYDLCIYKMDSQRNKYTLVNVKQQPIQSNYETLTHETTETNVPLTTILIMEVMLYHKTMLHTTAVLSVPFTRMYTLEEFSTGKAWSSIKRENPCYFISSGISKPENQQDTTREIKLTRQERPFIAKEYPIGDPDDPFECRKIQNQTDNRFRHLSFPLQGSASVCGPAAFFYCLQKDRPDVYAQAARELWQYGNTRIGHLELSPGEGCRHPSGLFYDKNGTPIISGLDWMTLASLRDSENNFFSFDELDSPVAGITLWENLSEWFEKAGYERVFSNVGVTQAGAQGIRELNEFVLQGYKVVTLINNGLLKDSDSNLTVPTHWIVWEGPVTEDLNGNIHLQLFSWGEVDDQIKPEKKLSFFRSRFFGGMVFKPLK